MKRFFGKLFHKHDHNCRFETKRGLVVFLYKLGVKSAHPLAWHYYEVAQERIRMHLE